jgi:hypothetical protein
MRANSTLPLLLISVYGRVDDAIRFRRQHEAECQITISGLAGNLTSIVVLHHLRIFITNENDKITLFMTIFCDSYNRFAQ